jgi:predicted transcriptional regulator
LLSAAILVALGCGCRGAAFSELDEARRVAADLRVQFAVAGDAENRAVMADTDEASIRFAESAKQTARLIEKDVAALTPLLNRLRLQNELRALEQFKSRYVEYRKLDETILELAVENTNLKAQRLSFGPAREAADRFKDALGVVATTGAVKSRCRVEALVAQAVLAVREIQVRQAPHIAEPDDAAMTRLEKEMNDLTARASSAVAEVSNLIEPSARAALSTAQAALDQFETISRQLVNLSRRNSNVRSLDLSLRAKPALSAACDESLARLQDALAKAGSQATR